MSRLTSTEVIDSGKYLEDDFDPMSLTVPHLTAILNYHNIQKPPQSNKTKLVQTFNDSIVPNRERYKVERKDMEDSEASVIGISDGMTGKQLVEKEPRHLRRSTRASSRGASLEPAQPLEPPKPKRRRSSSHQPTSNARQSTKASGQGSMQPPLLEESEPEDDEQPVKKIGRKGPSFNAEGSINNRRVSGKIGSGADDSPWEDTNIFQSGNESSSPIRPAKPRSSGSRQKRTSLSAPPETPNLSPSGSPLRQTIPSVSSFKPNLPSISQLRSPPRLDSSPLGRHIGADSFQIQEDLLDDAEDEAEDEDAEADPESDPDDEQSRLDHYNKVISSKLAGQRTSTSLVKRPTSSSRQYFIRIVFLIISALVIWPYKQKSESIGYCDANSSTNSVLKQMEEAHRAAERCSRLLAELKQYDADDNTNEALKCTPLGLIPFPTPHSCTPCPRHADCTPQTVTCHESFVIQPNILSSIPYADVLLNGIPGLGSVALPPKCVVDSEQRKKINVVGKAVEIYLIARKGTLICMDGSYTGAGSSPEDQARKYGVDREELKREIKTQFDRARKTRQGHGLPPQELVDFDGIYDTALKELQRVGLLISSTDDSGRTFFTSERTDLDVSCQVTILARSAWKEWRVTIFGWLTAFSVFLGLRRKVANNRIENMRVSGLVENALEQLRQQETAHHVDPVTHRHPFLSPLHLRDFVLREEHSVSARKRLWDKVERVVENNANVRVNMEELQGDEVRVWRWTGAGGNQLSYTPKKEEED